MMMVLVETVICLPSSEVAYKSLSLPDWTANTGVVDRDKYQNDLMKIDRIPIHHKG
jgi:hypothetical protein